MLTHDDYRIAWICALPLEMAAARAVLDKVHDKLEQPSTDHNNYCLGEIKGHNMVIACLPSGNYGTTPTATVVSHMLSTFPSIQFGLMVGIGGGVPSEESDIRLGDVVVSQPTGRLSGVIQYDLGKTGIGGHFEHVGALNQPPQVLLTAIAQLQSHNLVGKEGDKQILDFLSSAQEKHPGMKERFSNPGPEHDLLFQAGYDHLNGPYQTCHSCDQSQLIHRLPRDSNAPKVHYGIIASGNQVMKHGITRDRLAREHNILCFEMESAGLMNQLPCLAVRGICDYADSHKNERWQGYASLTATAYAKQLLSTIAPIGKGKNKRRESETALGAGFALPTSPNLESLPTMNNTINRISEIDHLWERPVSSHYQSSYKSTIIKNHASAVSSAATLFQLVDFGVKLISNALDDHRLSPSENARKIEFSTLSQQLEQMNGEAQMKLDLMQKNGGTVTPSDGKLASLCHHCQEVTNQLKEAMEDMAARGNNKVQLGTFRTVLNGVWSKDRITRLIKQMTEIRQDILLAVLVYIWEVAKKKGQQELPVNERVQQILRTGGGIDKITQIFAAKLTEISNGTTAEAKQDRDSLVQRLLASDVLAEQFLSHPSDEEAHQHAAETVQRQILEELSFGSMWDREDAIPKAYEKTFEWIFSYPEQTENKQPGSPNTMTFPDWLEIESDKVFWITGKPGSGKSTLMKFISGNERLTKHLTKWAGNLPLLYAGFYFWSGGKDLGKSIEGLLRSLLYQCFSKRPNLIPKVVSRRWLLLSILGIRIKAPGWSLEEYQRCLKEIASHNGRSFRFALFIDGLDEFEGGHRRIMDIIMDLVNQSGVKLCVASRPWNVFADAFKQHPTLRMQDLTQGDIANFIQRELTSSQGFQELSSLFSEESEEILLTINAKAEGVFLWVTLVVRSLVEILREDPRLSVIQKTLLGLPTDLEQLYQAIWTSIDPTKVAESSKIFQLVMTLDLGLDDRIGEPSCDAVTIWLACEADIENKKMEYLIKEAEKNVLVIMTRVLASHTRGILEVSEMGRVNFLHRTARDWMQKPDTWKEVCKSSPSSFDPNLSVVEALVLEMTWRQSTIPSTVFAFSNALARILCYAGRVEDSFTNGLKLVEVLDRLDSKLAEVANQLEFPSSFLQGARASFEPVEGYSALHWSVMFFDVDDVVVESSFANLAAIFAVLPYIKAKILVNEDIVRGERRTKRRRVALIESAVLGENSPGQMFLRLGMYLQNVPLTRRLQTVELLLAKGANPKDIYCWSDLARGELNNMLEASGKTAVQIEYWKEISDLVKQYLIKNRRLGPLRSFFKRY